MKNGIAPYLVILGGVLSAGALSAAPLQLQHVPVAPSFVLHLDADKLRPTPVGQFLLSELEKPEAADKLAAFQAMFSFDPRQQLHGITLYSTTTLPEDGVLLVYADVDAAKLVTLAKAAQEYQNTSHKTHVIHSWIDAKRKTRNGEKPRVYAAVVGSNTVVFGQKENSVAQALDLLDGTAAGLKEGSFWSFGPGSKNDFLQGAATKMALPDSDPNAAVLRLSKLVRFHLGETQGKIDGSLTMVTDNPEVSTNVTGIANGLVSLAKLKAKPAEAKLVEALSVGQEAGNVVLRFSVSTADVVELMKAKAAQKAAAKQSKAD